MPEKNLNTTLLKYVCVMATRQLKQIWRLSLVDTYSCHIGLF